MPSAIITCPFPFPDWELTTRVEIYQEEDTEDQGPIETLVYDGMAKYDQTSKNVFNADSKQIALSGKLIIKGDVQFIGNAPQGYVKIGDDTKLIYKVSKPSVMGYIVSTEVDLL